MKLAIISDIHDNEVRLREAIGICKENNVNNCICCGDIVQIETLDLLSSSFDKIWLALGNADYNLLNKMGLFPENIEYSENTLTAEIDNLKIAIVHNDRKAKDLANSNKYSYVFYGHSHTPWEKMVGQTILINPGEVAGQFGRATFATFDTKTQKAQLFLLK